MPGLCPALREFAPSKMWRSFDAPTELALQLPLGFQDSASLHPRPFSALPAGTCPWQPSSFPSRDARVYRGCGNTPRIGFSRAEAREKNQKQRTCSARLKTRASNPTLCQQPAKRGAAHYPRSENTDLGHPIFSSFWVGRRPMETRLKPCPFKTARRASFSATCISIQDDRWALFMQQTRNRLRNNSWGPIFRRL